MCVTKDKMQPKLKDIKSIIGYGLPLLLGPQGQNAAKAEQLKRMKCWPTKVTRFSVVC
jgi:hypothetical protein